MKKIAPYFVLLAGFCWGIIGIFTRQLSEYDFTPIQITTIRSCISVILLFFIIVIKNKRQLQIKIRDFWYFLGTGLGSIVFFNICYFYTLEHTTMSLASILLYTAPAIVIILSAIIYKEKITVKKILALFLSMMGCILSTGIIGMKNGNVSTVIILIGLGAGLGYALYSIFGNAAMKKYSPVTVTFYTFLVAFIGIVSFSRPIIVINTMVAHPSAVIWTILLGIVSTIIPFVAYTKALEYMENGKASIMAFSEPITATFCGVIIFKEKMTVSNLSGILLMFFGIMLLNIHHKPKKIAESNIAR